MRGRFFFIKVNRGSTNGVVTCPPTLRVAGRVLSMSNLLKIIPKFEYEMSLLAVSVQSSPKSTHKVVVFMRRFNEHKGFPRHSKKLRLQRRTHEY